MSNNTENEGLGSIFAKPDPSEQRKRNTEYWHWSDDATVGKMAVTRDGCGRFVEFHYYQPLVINGHETDAGERIRKNTLGEIFNDL